MLKAIQDEEKAPLLANPELYLNEFGNGR